MSRRSYIHVIDSDVRRRAQIARELLNRNLHAEIYEDLEEFGANLPREGAVMVADCSAACNPEALGTLLEASSNPLPFAGYSDDPAPEKIVAAMHHGAVDYLRWPFDAALLEAAFERLSTAGDRRAREYRRQAAARGAIEALSERELEVLALMTLGDSNKEIGRKLEISPRTVEIHRGNMMRKLHARSQSDAVRLAMLAGIDAGADDSRLAA